MFAADFFAPHYFPTDYWQRPVVVVSGGGGRFRSRVTTREKLPDLLAQLKRDDEDLLMIITLAVSEGLI